VAKKPAMHDAHIRTTELFHRQVQAMLEKYYAIKDRKSMSADPERILRQCLPEALRLMK